MTDRIDDLEQQLARTADELAGLQRLVEALTGRVLELDEYRQAHKMHLDQHDAALDRHEEQLRDHYIESPTPDLAAQLAEARMECADLRHQVAGKTALIDDMQEAMAERGRLVAEKFMSEQRTAEAIAAWLEQAPPHVNRTLAAEIRAGRWRVAAKPAAKEGE